MRTLLAAIVALAVAGPAGAQMSAPSRTMDRSMKTQAGTMAARSVAVEVGLVEGSASVKLGPYESWIPAQTGQGLSANSEVRTGGDGSVALAFSNGSKIRLGPNSNFKVEGTSPSKISMFLGIGKLEAWVKGLARRGTFSVRTPVAVASVRGSMFTLDLPDGKNLEARAFDDILTVMDNFGKSDAVQPGMQLMASLDKGNDKPNAMPPGTQAPKEPEVKIPPPPAPTAQPKGEQPPADEVPATESKTEAPPPNTPTQETTTVEEPCVPSVTPFVPCP